MAARSSGMPSTAVYLVWPERMAAMPASLILSGVSKSGSPAPRPITSRPAALSSRALVVTAMVGDGWIRPSDSARKPLGSVMRKALQKAHFPLATGPVPGKAISRLAGRRAVHNHLILAAYFYESENPCDLPQ